MSTDAPGSTHLFLYLSVGTPLLGLIISILGIFKSISPLNILVPWGIGGVILVTLFNPRGSGTGNLDVDDKSWDLAEVFVCSDGLKIKLENGKLISRAIKGPNIVIAYLGIVKEKQLLETEATKLAKLDKIITPSFCKNTKGESLSHFITSIGPPINP